MKNWTRVCFLLLFLIAIPNLITAKNHHWNVEREDKIYIQPNNVIFHLIKFT